MKMLVAALLLLPASVCLAEPCLYANPCVAVCTKTESGGTTGATLKNKCSKCRGVSVRWAKGLGATLKEEIVDYALKSRETKTVKAPFAATTVQNLGDDAVACPK